MQRNKLFRTMTRNQIYNKTFQKKGTKGVIVKNNINTEYGNIIKFLLEFWKAYMHTSKDVLNKTFNANSSNFKNVICICFRHDTLSMSPVLQTISCYVSPH